MKQFDSCLKSDQLTMTKKTKEMKERQEFYWQSNIIDIMKSINSYSASRDNWCTVGGDGGCRVGEIRAGTTSPMPDHKGFKLQ